MSNDRYCIDSPPPYSKIQAGHYKRPSFPSGPPGYIPYDPPVLPSYGSTPANLDYSLPPEVCPACRMGLLEDEYSYAMLICFCCCPFSFGKHTKCEHCGAYFY